MASDVPLRRVEVAVRVRPLPDAPSGATQACSTCIAVDGRRKAVTVVDTTGMSTTVAVQSHTYKQDLLFDEHCTNEEVFERLVRTKLQHTTPETPDTLCFLAYGQTSSGKTHTVAGSESEPGVLTLCVRELLRRDKLVEVSMLEVYAEKVYDLLSDSAPRRVRHRQGPAGPAIIVEDLSTCSLVSLAQWKAVSSYGMLSRRTAATERNARSSRSHAIFTVKSRGVRLCLVDLAGSERQTVFSPQMNQESIEINKSLSRLSTVLEALSAQRVREDGTRSYVNFRDTTLTVLLQRYLSGASMTTFLACVHPAAEFYPETLSTLRYTQRLKRIKTMVVRVGARGDTGATMTMPWVVGSAEKEELLNELARLRAQVEENNHATQLIDQAHRRRLAELERALEERHGASPSAPVTPPPASAAEHGTDSRVRAQRAKETKRVAGWLLARVLGDLPLLNVGYDDYFDGFLPSPLQAVGYVSTMSCLPPRGAESGGSGDPGLAFLDVGDLAMGVSMVDAGIPPMVRLHRVPCRDLASWEAHEWDAAGHGVYVLCFFETGEDAVEQPSPVDGSGLPCCGGCVSAEALLPIATLLCLPASSPACVKEEVLQWLIALQGQQDEACERHMGRTGSMTSFDGSVDAYLDNSSGREAAAAAAEEAEEVEEFAEGNGAAVSGGDGGATKARNRGSPTLTFSSSSSPSSVGGVLAREVERQSMDTTKLQTPFVPGSTSPSTTPSQASLAGAPHAVAEMTVAAPPPSHDSPLRENPAAGPGDVHVVLKDDARDGRGAVPLGPTADEAAPPTSGAPPPPLRRSGRGPRGKRPTRGGDRTVGLQSCHGCSVV